MKLGIRLEEVSWLWISSCLLDTHTRCVLQAQLLLLWRAGVGGYQAGGGGSQLNHNNWGWCAEGTCARQLAYDGAAVRGSGGQNGAMPSPGLNGALRPASISGRVPAGYSLFLPVFLYSCAWLGLLCLAALLCLSPARSPRRPPFRSHSSGSCRSGPSARGLAARLLLISPSCGELDASASPTAYPNIHLSTTTQSCGG